MLALAGCQSVGPLAQLPDDAIPDTPIETLTDASLDAADGAANGDATRCEAEVVTDATEDSGDAGDAGDAADSSDAG